MSREMQPLVSVAAQPAAQVQVPPLSRWQLLVGSVKDYVPSALGSALAGAAWGAKGTELELKVVGGGWVILGAFLGIALDLQEQQRRSSDVFPEIEARHIVKTVVKHAVVSAVFAAVFGLGFYLGTT